MHSSPAFGGLAPHGLRVWPTGPGVLQLSALQSLASLDGSADLRFLNTKNNYGQHYLTSVTSLAPPSHPLSRFPAASAFLRDVFIPVLDRLGIVRHPDCFATPESMAPCRVCPRLFPTISEDHSRARPSTGTMTSQHVSAMVRFWLNRLGVRDPSRWSGVSMRQGCASLAAVMKVAPEIVKWHGRWKHRGVPGIYTVKPPDARLAVSLAVGRSYVAASAASARRLLRRTRTCAMCVMTAAQISFCAIPICAGE